MRWPFRVLSGVLGVALVATAFVAFFHLVPGSWGDPSTTRVTLSESVRARTAGGWQDASRTRDVTYHADGRDIVATLELGGTVGPRDRSVRALLAPDLQVRATGAGGAALWAFPGRGPFEPRPASVPIAEVWMSEGAPLVVAVDTFTFAGTSEIAGVKVEHWIATHDAHRFVEDGRRFERVVERHAYVEPMTGLVVASHDHERLWIHWRDRLHGDPITTILQGPLKGREYVPVWDAWTNTTTASAESMASEADDIRTRRLIGMVGVPAPAMLSGEIGLWMMVRPPRRLGR